MSCILGRTYNPKTLTDLGAYYVGQGGVNAGIMGGRTHIGGYHLGEGRLFAMGDGTWAGERPTGTCVKGRGWNDDSVQKPRDKAGLSDAASAIDIGAINGSLPALQRFTAYLLAEINAPDAADLVQLIGSLNGTDMFIWTRGSGVQPYFGDTSHRQHTHLSYFRDSEGRDKTPLFRRYFEEATMALAPISDHTPKLIDLPVGATQFDEDGKTPAGKTAGGTAIPSPCATKNGTVVLRGYWISVTTGVYGLRFAAPSKVYDPPLPGTPQPVPTKLGPGLYEFVP